MAETHADDRTGRDYFIHPTLERLVASDHIDRSGTVAGKAAMAVLSKTSPLIRLVSWIILAAHSLQQNRPITQRMAFGASPPVDRIAHFFNVGAGPRPLKSPRQIARPSH